MLLGKYVITSHVIEQYDNRIKNKRFNDVRTCIKNDLKVLNIRRIVNVGDKTHVFTKGYKEFVFTRASEDKDLLILRTVIKRNMDETRRIIEYREVQKAKMRS